MRVGRVAGMFGTVGLAVCAAPSRDAAVLIRAASGSSKEPDIVVGTSAVKRLDTVIKENWELMVASLIVVGKAISVGKGDTGGRVNTALASTVAELARTSLPETAVGPIVLITVPGKAALLPTNEALVITRSGVLVIVLPGLVGTATGLGELEAMTEPGIAEGALLLLATWVVAGTAFALELTIVTWPLSDTGLALLLGLGAVVGTLGSEAGPFDGLDGGMLGGAEAGEDAGASWGALVALGAMAVVASALLLGLDASDTLETATGPESEELGGGGASLGGGAGGDAEGAAWESLVTLGGTNAPSVLLGAEVSVLETTPGSEELGGGGASLGGGAGGDAEGAACESLVTLGGADAPSVLLLGAEVSVLETTPGSEELGGGGASLGGGAGGDAEGAACESLVTLGGADAPSVLLGDEVSVLETTPGSEELGGGGASLGGGAGGDAEGAACESLVTLGGADAPSVPLGAEVSVLETTPGSEELGGGGASLGGAGAGGDAEGAAWESLVTLGGGVANAESVLLLGAEVSVLETTPRSEELGGGGASLGGAGAGGDAEGAAWVSLVTLGGGVANAPSVLLLGAEVSVLETTPESERLGGGGASLGGAGAGGDAEGAAWVSLVTLGGVANAASVLLLGAEVSVLETNPESEELGGERPEDADDAEESTVVDATWTALGTFEAVAEAESVLLKLDESVLDINPESEELGGGIFGGAKDGEDAEDSTVDDATWVAVVTFEAADAESVLLLGVEVSVLEINPESEVLEYKRLVEAAVADNAEESTVDDAAWLSVVPFEAMAIAVFAPLVALEASLLAVSVELVGGILLEETIPESEELELGGVAAGEDAEESTAVDAPWLAAVTIALADIAGSILLLEETTPESDELEPTKLGKVVSVEDGMTVVCVSELDGSAEANEPEVPPDSPSVALLGDEGAKDADADKTVGGEDESLGMVGTTSVVELGEDAVNEGGVETGSIEVIVLIIIPVSLEDEGTFNDVTALEDAATFEGGAELEGTTAVENTA